MSDLDIISPEPRIVLVNGKEISVLPLTVGQLPRLVRTAGPIVNAVLAVEAVPDDEDLVSFAVALMADHGEALISAVAIATGQTEDAIAAANPVEFTDLAKCVFEVNRDFFLAALGLRRPTTARVEHQNLPPAAAGS